MPEEKLKKLNSLLSAIKKDSVSQAQLKEFVDLILNVVGKAKNELDSISDARIKELQSAINSVIRELDNKNKEVDTKISKAESEFKSDLKEAKKILKELKSIEIKDGKDADEELIVDKVLERIELPEYKETVLDDGDAIIAKINASEAKIDPTRLVLPEDVMIEIDGMKKKLKEGLGGSTARNLYQLIDVNLTNIADGDLIQYDSSNGTWVNVTPQSIEEVTLNEVSGYSTDAAKSTYLMSSGVDVLFQDSSLSDVFKLTESTGEASFSNAVNILNAANLNLSATSNGDGRITGIGRATFINNGYFGTTTGAFITFNDSIGSLFAKNVRMDDDLYFAFGTGRDYSLGYQSSTDTFQIVDGNTLGTNVRMQLDSSGNFVFGGTTASARIHAISTTEQLRIGYDTLNFAGATVDSLGNLEIELNGTTPYLAIGYSLPTISGNGAVRLGGAGTLTGSSTYAVSIGYAASVSASEYSIAMGWAASVTGATNGIAIGRGSGAGSSDSIALGRQATVPNGAPSAIAIGYLSNAGNNYAVALGRQANAGFNQSIAIGYAASTGAAVTGGTALGWAASATANYAIGLGYNVTSDIANALQVGFGTNQSFFVNEKSNLVLDSQVDLTSGTHFDATATNTLTIHEGTAPSGRISNAVQIYVQDDQKLVLDTDQVQMTEYGSGTFTGTLAYNLGVDSSGNFIEKAPTFETDATFSTTTTATVANKWYIFTGSTGSQELDLPAGVSGTTFHIKNRGTVSFDVDPNGSEEIYHLAALGAGVVLTINPGEGVTLHWDGTYWVTI